LKAVEENGLIDEYQYYGCVVLTRIVDIPNLSKYF